MAATTGLDIRDCGDSALRVAVTGDQETAWRCAHALAQALRETSDEHITSALPTYDAVLVEFDCVATGHARVRRLVRQAAERLDDTMPVRSRLFNVPVVYGGELGPDLEATARVLRIEPADVVGIHTAHPLVMRCFGSPAGAPMMDGPDFSLPIPRLASPRPRVPAGAAAVAGRQAVISTRPAPGGWYVLGTTPMTIVDATRDPISSFWPGDRFQFRAIDESDFDANRGFLQ